MNVKITFHAMPHSDVIQEHINQKLQKLEKHLASFADSAPFFVEFWVKAQPQHAHHGAELHLKASQLDLHAHDEGPELYVVIDSVIDTMIRLVDKERDKRRDLERRGIAKEDRLAGLVPEEEGQEE